MAGVTLHPLQWVVAILLVATTHVWCAPYLKTAPGAEGSQQPPLDHLFSPDQGLIGPLFRQNDYSIDPPTMGGCYYQFRPYDEGDRIVTNEPCLNCTCHNSMLMCYLKVCPFSKPIGQDCTIEKDPNQCCPVITCPQVPVGLEVVPESTLTTTKSPTSTAVVPYTKHGCTIADEFYPDGAQVPGDPKNPCELCYCIRNHTACLMQECILKVEGCKPVFEDAICCPVRYMCEYDEEELLQITTTLMPIMNETIITTLPPHIGGCTHDFNFYADGAQIPSEDPCEHCYCMKNDIVCAIQECRSPLDEDDEHCVPRLPPPGQCCPEAYDCHGVQLSENVTSVVESPDLIDLQTRERQHRLEDATTDETTTISAEHTTDAYSPFGIEAVVETEKPTIEDKEIIHIKPVEETTLEYVTAEIVTVTKRPEVPLTTDKATVPEEAFVETTEEEKAIFTDTTEAPAIEEVPAEITKSTDSDSDLLETRTTDPDDEMFLTTTPMSDETTLKPDTEAAKEVTMPTITAAKPEEKLPEPTLKPAVISETDVEFDVDVTPEPKIPATDITTKPDEKETVTEEIVSKDTTLSPIDSLETTSVKEELIEVSMETTTSEKLEPVDVMTTKAPTVPEDTTTEDVEAVTDIPTIELTPEATTPDTKPDISETTTLSPEVLLETTSPKEDITEISIETTTEKVDIVDVTSKATESPVAAVTDIVDMVTTISDVEDIVETTTTFEIEPVTGVIDPKIQLTITKKPVVAPVDGCLSNGTIYEEGDLVPIVNACQENCLCTSGVVTCQQTACPSPPPAFLRCDTQKNPKECCPQYECPMIQPDPVPSPNCISNGQQYLEGEFIPSPDSCTDCYCLYGEMICAYQECPEVEAGCKPLEIPEGSCCPSKYECPVMEILDLTLTTMPSVEVSEVTTFPPKELPEDEITSTEPTDVFESDVATTPSQIPEELITEKPVDEISTIVPDVTKEIEVVTPMVVTEKEIEVVTPEVMTEKEIDVVTPEIVTEKEIEVVTSVVTEKEIEVVTPEVVTEKEVTETPAEITLAPEVIKVKPETTTDDEIDVELTTAEPVEIVETTTSDADIELLTATPAKEITTPEVEDEVTTKSTPAEPLVKETTVKPVEAITDPVIVSVEEIHEDEEDVVTTTEPAELLEPVTTPLFETTKIEEMATTKSSIEITTLEYDTEKIPTEIPAEIFLPVEVTETTVSPKVVEITDDTVLTMTELPIDKEGEIATTTEIMEELTEMPAKITTIYEEPSEPVTTPIAAEVPYDLELTTTLEPAIEVATSLTETEAPVKEIVDPGVTTETAVAYSPSTEAIETVDEATTAISVETEEPVTGIEVETEEPVTESEVDVTDKPATLTTEALTTISQMVETTDLPDVAAVTGAIIDELTTTVPIVEIVSETTKVVETVTDEIITDYIPPSSKKPETELATTMVPIFEGCWWFDNNLHEHGDSVPSENTCQENCICMNGIVRCQHKACPPSPPSFLRCTETSSNDSCCPTFECAPSPTTLKCEHNGQVFEDNEYIPSDTLCQDCFCLSGEVVCAELVCGVPRMNCEPTVQKENECCPSAYECLETVIPALTTTSLPEEEPKATDIISTDEDGAVVTTVPTVDIYDTTTKLPQIVTEIKVTTVHPDETLDIEDDQPELPEVGVEDASTTEFIAADITSTTHTTTSTLEDVIATTSVSPLVDFEITTEPIESVTTKEIDVSVNETTILPVITIDTATPKEVTEEELETTTIDKIEQVDVTTIAIILPEQAVTEKEAITDDPIMELVTVEIETVTEEIVSKDTTLAPIDSLETTSVKEELIEVSVETTTSEKLEPVDEMPTKAPTVPEETTTEDVEAVTDVPIKELTTEADTKPEISETTTLSPEVLLETTSPKEDITEISIETTTEKVDIVDVTSKATESPVAAVTDIVDKVTTISDVEDIVETTTTFEIEPVTGVIDPKIQPTITKKPVVAPVDGCLSNRTIYEEGDLVPIVNACQENCLCTSGVVTCQQIACPSPPPAFLRCDTQKNPKECCPQYECPMIQPDPVPSPNCISNGQQYLEGEFIPSPDSCTDCYCLYGEMICAYQECPEVEAGCKPLEIPEGSCCPSKYECPAMEILDLTLTTMPSVEVSEVTTFPPKELPEVEVTSTEPTDVIEPVVATTPSQIPDELITEKPVDEISTIVPDVTKEIEVVTPMIVTEKEIEVVTPEVVTEKEIEVVTPEVVTEKEIEVVTPEVVTEKEIDVVTPEVVTEKEIDVLTSVVTEKEIEVVTPEVVTEKEVTETPAEVTLAPVDIKVKPETTTDVSTETPKEQDLMTTEAEIDVEIATTEPVETVKTTTSDADIELSTAQPEKEITTPEVEVEVTTVEITDELETTPAEPLVKETTVKSVEAITEPVLVSVEEIHEDEEAVATVTEPADLLEPVTTAVVTESPIEVTTLEYDIETPSEKPAETVLPEEVTEPTVPSKVVDIAGVEILTTTELPVDAETKVSLTPDVIEETTKLDIVTTTMAEEITETSIAPIVEVVTETEVTTAAISEIEILDLMTDSKLPEEVAVTTEAIVQPEETTADTLLDVQTDKAVEVVTDTPLDLTTIPEKEIIAVDEFTTTPKVDIDVVAEITTTEIPVEIIMTPISEVQTEKSTELPVEIITATTSLEVDIDTVAEITTTQIPVEIVTTPTSEVQTERSTDIPVEIITTTTSPEVDIDAVANITTTETPVEIDTTTTSKLPTEKTTDLPVETITTIHVSPDIEETTPAVVMDTTIIPYFEGCWWFDDKLYEHGESVPSDNSCQENCRCINGTVRCQYKACPPKPPTFLNCTETFNNESCCTTYECAPLPTNLQCMHQGKIYADGDYIPSETLCFDCYCVEGEVICADLICGIPRSDCDAIMQRADECCPTSYECKEMVSLDMFTTTLAPELDLTTTVTTTISTVEDLIEPKIKNVTSIEPVEITPSPDVVTDEITADEETLPEIPEKVPAEVITDVQYIPPTTVSPNETTTWTPTTTTELVIGPGSCLFNGKVYVSAQQIPREDPCDFCFCFRGDIICLQQTCPPPIPGCYEEAISGFCCPRYECPVKQSVIEITTTTTPFPSFPPLYKTSRETVCEVDGIHYPVGQVIPEASSPCHECICGKDGFMKCLPKECDSHRKLSIHSYR